MVVKMRENPFNQKYLSKLPTGSVDVEGISDRRNSF